MNARERFLSVMSFQKPDRGILWELGYWHETVMRWYTEGLPKVNPISKQCAPDYTAVHGPGLPWMEGSSCARDLDIALYFGLDEGVIRVPVYLGLWPPFEREILEDEGPTQTIRDEQGIIKRVRKDGGSAPCFLSHPVKDQDTWEEIKQRLQPQVKFRIPNNLPELTQKWQKRTYPLCIGGAHYGLFGTPRDLMGFERFLYAFYDQPRLITEIILYLADFWIAVYDEVLSLSDNSGVRPDFAQIWEDMAYRGGPFISPQLFRQFLAPGYKKLVGFFQDWGIKIVLVDSDGDVSRLIPEWLEVGITGIYPLEVAAGMDVTEIRENFPHLQMIGGLDKRALVSGKAAIDQELEKVANLVSKGGYIPCIDHLVPPDVSWGNFRYYRERLNAILRNL